MLFSYKFKTICSLLLLALATSIYAQGQPTYQSFTTKVGKDATVIVGKPTGTVQNDLLVVGLMFEKGSSEIVTAPIGWTLIKRTNNMTNCGMASFYKIAGADEPETYTFLLTSGSKWAAGISRISNVDASAPIDVSGEAIGFGSVVGAPSVTTTGKDRLILCFYTNKKNGMYTPAGETTERYDHPNAPEGLPSNMMASFLQATAGQTGNKNATSAESEQWIAQQIAISAPDPITPYPVTIASFNVKKNGIDAVLTWKTAMEFNNKGFEIEASTDGLNYTLVDYIQAKSSTTSQGSSYTYIDMRNGKEGTIYYRLKQIDHDGKFEYFGPKAVEFGKANINVTAYPNPFTSEFALTMGTIQAEEMQLYVANTIGEVVLKQRVKIQAGLNREHIQIPADLPSGFYVVTAMWSGQAQSVKLLKK